MPQLSPFHKDHQQRNANMVEQDDWLLPADYGDAAAEYRACREHLAVFDHSARSRLRVSGPGAAAALARLLPVGAALPPEHRQCRTVIGPEPDTITDVVWIQHQGNSFLVSGEPARRAATRELLAAAAAADDAACTDETAKTAMAALYGPQALTMLREKLPVELGDMTPGEVIIRTYFFMRLVVGVGDGQPAAGVTLTFAAKMAAMAWAMLDKYGQAYGARPAGTRVWEALRIEAGLPAVGAELRCREDAVALGLAPPSGSPPGRQLVGLSGPAEGLVPGAVLHAHGAAVGAVTSSACLNGGANAVALAWLGAGSTAPETLHTADGCPCRLCPLPMPPGTALPR